MDLYTALFLTFWADLPPYLPMSLALGVAFFGCFVVFDWLESLILAEGIRFALSKASDANR